MTNQDLICGRDTLPTDVDQHILLADQSQSSKSIKNDLWLVNQLGMFAPPGILYENKCFLELDKRRKPMSILKTKEEEKKSL